MDLHGVSDVESNHIEVFPCANPLNHPSFKCIIMLWTVFSCDSATSNLASQGGICMADISIVFAVSVFVAGVLSFFAPCIIPLLPVYVAHLSASAGEEGTIRKTSKPESGNPACTEGSCSIDAKPKYTVNWRLVLQTLVFVSGLGTVFVIMGFGAGALGGLLSGRIFVIVGGILVILLGLHQTGLFHLMFLERERRVMLKDSAPKGGILGSYLLGLTFSFGWTPCVGPVLATVLVLASNGNQMLYGAGLMLIYTIGLAIPFLLISFFTDYLVKSFRKLSRHLPKIRIVGGILIMIMGVLLMTSNLHLLSNWLIQR